MRIIPRLGISTSVIFEWPSILRARRCNWINFTPIHVGFEAGAYKGRYIELTVVLLGVGLCVDVYGKTSRSVFSAGMDQRIAAIKDGSEKLHSMDEVLGELWNDDESEPTDAE